MQSRKKRRKEEDKEKRMERNDTLIDHDLVVPNIPPTFIFLIDGFANNICRHHDTFYLKYLPEMQSLTCLFYELIIIQRY